MFGEKDWAFDRYEPLGVLGEGGQARVFEARDRLTGDSCAIKLIDGATADEHLLARARQEARLLAQLDHPSLCGCRELLEDPRGRSLGLVMELIHGVSLAQVQPEVLLNDRGARVLEHVADALAHVHAAGLVHRDLKPENIMLAPGFLSSPELPQHVRVVDFGIAALVGERHRITQPGWVVGTPPNMAPEQLASGMWSPQTPAACNDVFAFGVLMWGMLIGGHPTGLSSSGSMADFITAYRIAEADPRWPRAEIPEPMRTVLRGCLAIRSDERYPSGEQLRDALKRARRGARPCAPTRVDRVVVPRTEMAAPIFDEGAVAGITSVERTAHPSTPWRSTTVAVLAALGLAAGSLACMGMLPVSQAVFVPQVRGAHLDTAQSVPAEPKVARAAAPSPPQLSDTRYLARLSHRDHFNDHGVQLHAFQVLQEDRLRQLKGQRDAEDQPTAQFRKWEPDLAAFAYQLGPRFDATQVGRRILRGEPLVEVVVTNGHIAVKLVSGDCQDLRGNLRWFWGKHPVMRPWVSNAWTSSNVWSAQQCSWQITLLERDPRY